MVPRGTGPDEFNFERAWGAKERELPEYAQVLWIARLCSGCWR